MDDALHIATAQPAAIDLFDMLAKKAGVKNSKVSYATDSGVSFALHLFKQGLQDTIDQLIAANENGAPPVAEIVDQMFDYAFDSLASDVYIEPGCVNCYRRPFPDRWCITRRGAVS